MLILILVVVSCKRPDTKTIKDNTLSRKGLFQDSIINDSLLFNQWKLNKVNFIKYVVDEENRRKLGGRKLTSSLFYEQPDLIFRLDKEHKIYVGDSLVGTYQTNYGDINNQIQLNGSWQSPDHPLFLNTRYSYWIYKMRLTLFVDVYVEKELNHRIEYFFSRVIR